MTNQFLPKSYEEPKSTSNYFRFQDGINSFRILGNAIIGWEYFNTENKPVRSKEPFESTPDIKKDGKVKHFWAFPIWNYQEKKVQIMELTQKSIQKAIMALINNPKWGDVKMFDISIIKSGEGLETEYTIQAEPPIGTPANEILEAFSATKIDLEKLFTNGDPFKS